MRQLFFRGKPPMEIKKPQVLRPLISIHYMRSSYIDLPNRFILKTYSLVPTT